jgi:serine/threonine-protein kinase RsbT
MTSHHDPAVAPVPQDLLIPTAIPIRGEADLARARTVLRRIARALGFTTEERLILGTVVSELARNIVDHAGVGEIVLAPLEGRRGLRVVAIDDGPGFADADRATGRGFGLAAVRRLMDDLSVETARGTGTTVACTKWIDHDSDRTAA